MENIIYENEILEIGIGVEELSENMIVLFGDNVPDSLKDFCYLVSINDINGTIQKGQKLNLDNEQFIIDNVGDLAQKNLGELGHLTILFNANKEEMLPGAIIVLGNNDIKIKKGTKIKIFK